MSDEPIELSTELVELAERYPAELVGYYRGDQIARASELLLDLYTQALSQANGDESIAVAEVRVSVDTTVSAVKSRTRPNSGSVAGFEDDDVE